MSSHSEFSNLQARDVQAILRERLILVHGVPIDYKYGWDLESMDRLFDVDKKVNVHGEVAIAFFESMSKMLFSYVESSPPLSRTSTSSWMFAGFVQPYAKPLERRMPPFKRHLFASISKEPIYSPTVW